MDGAVLSDSDILLLNMHCIPVYFTDTRTHTLSMPEEQELSRRKAGQKNKNSLNFLFSDQQLTGTTKRRNLTSSSSPLSSGIRNII